MAEYVSPNIVFEERASESPQRLINNRLKGGAVLPANDGSALKPITINNDTEVFETFGNPNDYNFQYHKQITDFSAPGNPIIVVRPLHSSAKNADLQLRGISHKKLDSWFTSNLGRNLTRNAEKFYNEDVADVSLNYEYSTEYKLDVIRRYVSSKKDIAVAVCSNIKHFNEPIMNANIDVIRNFNVSTPSNNPSKYEKYTILRDTLTTTSTDSVTKKFIVVGDVTSKIKTGDKLIVTGTNALTVTVATSTFLTPNTEIVVTEAVVNSTNDVINYLNGSWSTLATLTNGSLVEYSGSAWTVIDPASIAEKYYVELLGAPYKKVGSNWIKITDEFYVPIDLNNDGKADIAQADIFSTELLNSSGVLVSFNDLLTTSTNFENNEIFIVVLRKNMLTNKWLLAETHFGNYSIDHKDANNNNDFIESMIYNSSDYIYVKTGHKSFTPTAITANTVTVENENLSHIQVGEKIILTNFSENGVAVARKELNIISSIYTLGDTETVITFAETLTTPTVSGTSRLSDELAGKVSTNRNYYCNKFDTRYNISNVDASDGYSLEQCIVYDIAPTNSQGTTITDYSNIDNNNIDNGADVFKDKDNIDIGLLLGYETVDEFGVTNSNKMAEIAIFREQCLAVVSPWNINLFNFSDKDTTTNNIINQYGNNRTSKFSGNFTKYSTFVRVEGNMKYDIDPYNNNKYRWYGLNGDIAGKISTNSTNPNRGAEYPIAGINGGELQNQRKLAFVPTFEQRERLNRNGINTVYVGVGSQTPIIFSNLTSYDLPVPVFQTSSYRMLLNTIESFFNTNLFTRFFKYKTPEMKLAIADGFNSYIAPFITRGSVQSANLTFPVIKGENPKNLTMELKLVINPVITSFKLIINASEAEVTIDEVQ